MKRVTYSLPEWGSPDCNQSMWNLKLLLLVFGFLPTVLGGGSASAAITIAEIRNASRVEGIGTNTINIYGGTAGQFSRCGLSGGNSDAICNNCRLPEGSPENPGDAGLLACNSARIYPGLILRIRMSSDSVDGFPVITDSTGNTPVPLLETYPVIPKGTVVEIGVLWQELCARIFASASPAQTAANPPCDPISQVNAQLRFGFSSVESGGTTLSGTGTDSQIIQFTLRSQAGQAADLSADQSLVLPCSDPDSVGLCDFSVGPGDQKAILRSFEAASSDFPVSQNTTFIFARVLFDTRGFDFVHAGSPYVDLPISATQPFTISPKRIEDLENDQQYFFKVAVVDKAGNVGYYTPTAGQDPLRQSTIPSEVVGILSEDDCFIATAAYGSPLAREIHFLRAFRSAVLLQTTLGRKLVRAYYRWSPPIAAWIADREWARSLTRSLLKPIVRLAAWTNKLTGPLSIAVGSFWVTVLLVAAVLLIVAVLTLTVQSTRLAVQMATLHLRGSHKMSKARHLSQFFLAFAIAASLARPFAAAAQEPEAEAAKSAPEAKVSDAAVKPPPEFPQPGAQIEDEFESPSALVTPEAGVEPVERPKGITEEGDYFYDKKAADEHRVYGKPIAPPYSNEPEREAPIQITEAGDFFYKLDSSERGGSAGLKFGVLTPPTIQNPDNNLTFEDVYGDQPLPSLMLDYEFSLTRQIGLVGLRIESGLMVSQATGRFRRADRVTEEADEEFTFVMVPLVAHLVYRFQYSDNQFVVPFVEGGGGYFGIVELRDDGKQPRIGGAPATSFGGGFSFLLDFLDRKAIAQLDQDYGINHVWFTLQVRQLVGLKSSIDMTARQYFGGLTLDF